MLKVPAGNRSLLCDWVEIYRSSPPKEEATDSISVEHATINGNVLYAAIFR